MSRVFYLFIRRKSFRSFKFGLSRTELLVLRVGKTRSGLFYNERNIAQPSATILKTSLPRACNR
jgi:hypothetical protein